MDVKSFLKRNGFKKMEANSYANDKCNVVFSVGGGYEVADNEGNVMYYFSNHIYWLIGYLTYQGFIDKNYIN